MNFGVATILSLTFIAWQVYDGQAAFLGDRLVANAHNEKRRLESSSNMKLLTWDPELEVEAADYAEKCIFEHASDLVHGENLYATSGSYSYARFQRALDRWYDEKEDYDVGDMSCDSGKVCGHYTAIVWANTERVGCAAQFCSSGIREIPNWSSGTIVVCRYAPAGNIRGREPYEKGSACSACDDDWSECDNGLCSKEAAVTDPQTTVTVSPATEPTVAPEEETDDPPEEMTTASPPVMVTTTKEGKATTPQPTVGQGTTTTHTPDTTTPMTEEPNTTPTTDCPSDPSPSCYCSKKWKSALSDWKHHFEIWKAELSRWQEEKCQELEL